jgi:endonuclease III
MPPKLNHLPALQAKYQAVAAPLEARYGRKTFHPHDGMDELVSCILSQSTTDANRDRGFAALKARYADWAAVHHAPRDELIEVIRPAGLANSKGPRIQGALAQIQAERGEYNLDFLQQLSVAEAKDWLMRLPGVGPKTAAIVLCFAYGLPAFPVDTHVHRVGIRLGFLPPKISADDAHPVMDAIVPPDEYYPFHLQMIYHGRALCQARRPLCEQCPLADYCDYFTTNQKNR